ncbi:PglZ domain-containing protein [Halorubrum sp. Hd13]|uniref:PglZ domain-containing protein n=1 Tax=Halorubrum sp. Hd13 TaxID=1480728 RepID=UPI0011401D20|nr:PglZ domain-containing protein [Halorubrum sp. Hd13]
MYNRDWDALIILDACRVDALREVENEYEFLTADDSITSVGSTSFEWMNHTFDETYRSEIEQTAYISGNTYTERVLTQNGDTGHAAAPFGPSEYDVVNPASFGYIEELWRAQFDDDSEWSICGEVGSRVHPRYTTDRAIAAGRAQPTKQLIVHYMYPHDPYPLATDEDLFQPFDSLRSGEITRGAAWTAYLTNLRFVLDEVERLLENLDAEKVAITADHGEAFGEYGFYRHVIGCPLPCMRKVPWAETSATDEKTYTSYAPDPESTTESTSAEKRLEDLGYL